MRLRTIAFFMCWIGVASPEFLWGQSDFDEPPIQYRESIPSDRVGRLAAKLEDQSASLDWSDQHGWLPALLNALDVPKESQTLVFSKTSKQLQRISPSRPRAIYFNDEVYLGWVQNGDFVELAAVDSKLGAVFYTIEQKKSSTPKIHRDRDQCMSCHGTNKTKSVPGFLIRSVYPKHDGHPEFRLGTTTTDHSTPLHDRFGGWYVTGEHGAERHRGNVTVTGPEDNPLDRELGSNLLELPKQVRTKAYVQPTSDIVALMLLEHQTQFHNLVTAANYECRKALHYQLEMNRILKRDPGFQIDSTTRRVNSATEKLIKYLFFCGEYQLQSPISGNSGFADGFEKRGPIDNEARSLRQLDLQTRLLRYPCSYLVYLDSFLKLPEPVLKQVKKRMLEVLSGEENGEDFKHLTAEDRKAVLEILQETHPLFKEPGRE